MQRTQPIVLCGGRDVAVGGIQRGRIVLALHIANVWLLIHQLCGRIAAHHLEIASGQRIPTAIQMRRCVMREGVCMQMLGTAAQRMMRVMWVIVRATHKATQWIYDHRAAVQLRWHFLAFDHFAHLLCFLIDRSLCCLAVSVHSSQFTVHTFCLVASFYFQFYPLCLVKQPRGFAMLD